MKKDLRAPSTLLPVRRQLKASNVLELRLLVSIYSLLELNSRLKPTGSSDSYDAFLDSAKEFEVEGYYSSA